MKITNFNLVTTYTDVNDMKVFTATIDVETGMLWWKNKRTVPVQKIGKGFWFSTENGEFTPGGKVEALARAWTAKTGEET